MKDGGQAFPLAIPAELAGFPTKGMSLRDWFAGMALQGLLAFPGGDTVTDQEKLAECCYLAADAMLAEREKEA